MLEDELRDLISEQLAVIDPGLQLLDIEAFVPNEIGTRSFIDILARDRNDRWVLIEVKRSNASAREAIHEIYKYVEAVKVHFGARDDEIRTFVLSTEWKELLVPFSRFVEDTSISVIGKSISIDEGTRSLTADTIEPVVITGGRVLSAWHEISLYQSSERLADGIASYDSSCKAKSITDYIMVVLRAPAGFHEAAVQSTAASLNLIHGGSGEPDEQEVAKLAADMEQLEHMIYFVPQLQSAEHYLKIIRSDPDLREEVEEWADSMEGDELLCSLQGYALDAQPKVDRDYLEIGYPAKFKNKILEDEGWIVQEIIRRGAFSRNNNLSDEIILGEICGDAGTSGQGLKRTVALSNTADCAQLLKDVKECLPNNPVWQTMVRHQVEEAQADYPACTMDVSIFAPSTGMMTLFFATTQDERFRYIPNYNLAVKEGDDLRRMYVGELKNLIEGSTEPELFQLIISKYYEGHLSALVMSMTWGGYEARDIDILEDLGLIYSSFRCDVDGDHRQFYRMANGRWRETEPVEILGEFQSFLDSNDQLLQTIVHKLQPRISGGLCDGSPAELQLEKLIDAKTTSRATYFVNAPERCQVCGISLATEPFMSDGAITNLGQWAIMCADCTLFYGEGIGCGVGQLYRKESDGSWLLVGGSCFADDELS